MSQLIRSLKFTSFITLVSCAVWQTQSNGADLLQRHREMTQEIQQYVPDASVEKRTLWLPVNEAAIAAKKITMPRICAPIKSITWKDESKTDIKFVPEPNVWVFSWKNALQTGAVIRVDFDQTPILPQHRQPARPAGDGTITLHAAQAETYGEKLRFEPQWYKNTVGYWTVEDDYATWKLVVNKPGIYSVAVLQGCGEGHGGSDAEISLRTDQGVQSRLSFQTIDTGHFQNFRWNDLGNLKIKNADEFELRIDAKRIAKGALFDVRTIQLVKQAQSI